MSWDAVGALGDLIGGVAVVVSLVYLAIQVRHSARITEENTREVSASARESIFTSFSRWRALVADERLTRVFVLGCEDISELSREERFQFGLLMQDLLYANQVLYTRGLEGSSGIPPETAIENATSVLVRPGANEWWARNLQRFMPDFSRAVSKSVAAALERQAVPGADSESA
jgi:hypothetical protein